MENISRILMIGGIVLFLVGGLIFLISRTGLPLGRLPGDIHIEGENTSFHFPLASSIIISIMLTIFLNVILRFLNR
jgi:hypothetical protein